MGFSDRLESLVDRAVGIFSAKAAVSRKHFRMYAKDPDYKAMYDATVRAGYRAARTGNNTGWVSNHNATADMETLTDLRVLRNRSRELERDDSLGSGVIKTFVSNVIGTGMNPQCRIKGNDDKANRIEQTFDSLANGLSPDMDLTHAERQQIIFSRVLVDGEVLVRRVKQGNNPVWFQMIEADRLMSLGNVAPVSNNEIRQGVERDGDGKIVAYWIYKYTTDEMWLNRKPSGPDFIRVPKDEIKHLKRVSRPQQSRGVPFCHSIMQDIRDLDLLMVASLKRVQLACLIAVFIKSNRPIDTMPGQTTGDPDGGKKLQQTIEPGMIMKLMPDEEIQTLIPNFPVPEFVPFIIMLARRIGAALGICWQMVLKDFSQSSYSSARTDILEARRTFIAYQKWFAQSYLTWEWTEVLKDALLRNETNLSDVDELDIASVQWIGNGWAWVDPLKDAEATKLKMETGVTNLRDVADELGMDWQDLMVQKLTEEKTEIDLRKEMGLPPMPTPAEKAGIQLPLNDTKAAWKYSHRHDEERDVA